MVGVDEITQTLGSKFAGPGVRLVPELCIDRSAVRVDLTRISADEMWGAEIKSEADSLKRLPHQAEAYSQVFDRCFLVAAHKHIEKAVPLLPEWWGVLSVAADPPCRFSVVRVAMPNPAPEPLQLAQLLWRAEALEELHRLGLAKGVTSSPRRVLWHRLADKVDPQELRATVRRRLLERENWRGEDGPGEE